MRKWKNKLNLNRSLTRHHKERMKNRVKTYNVCHDPNDPKCVGMLAKTRKQCNCPWCGNPRKVYKGKEKRKKEKRKEKEAKIERLKERKKVGNS